MVHKNHYQMCREREREAQTYWIGSLLPSHLVAAPVSLWVNGFCHSLGLTKISWVDLAGRNWEAFLVRHYKHCKFQSLLPPVPPAVTTPTPTLSSLTLSTLTPTPLHILPHLYLPLSLPYPLLSLSRCCVTIPLDFSLSGAEHSSLRRVSLFPSSHSAQQWVWNPIWCSIFHTLHQVACSLPRSSACIQ